MLGCMRELSDDNCESRKILAGASRQEPHDCPHSQLSPDFSLRMQTFHKGVTGTGQPPSLFG